MCCFSQPVALVADTSIFARASTQGRQFLVYSMRYAAAAELAMVLPLPVPPRPPDDAVRFVSLQDYPAFFHDLAYGFEDTGTLADDEFDADAPAAATLAVHEVGDFVASFVPTVADFARLDERFRIGRDIWDHLPGYHDFGFAVFQLKETPSKKGFFGRLFGGPRPEAKEVHPMAFEFPRRNPDLLYFPTLHVHDRTVHPHAAFDHLLYCQTEDESAGWLAGWRQSHGPASQFMDVARTQGIVADQPCWRLTLKGRLQNKDTLVGRTSQIPTAATT